MTGPITPPPPSGPGRDPFGDHERLATVACDFIDPLEAWVEGVAALAPPLTDVQRADLSRIFGGQVRAA